MYISHGKKETQSNKHIIPIPNFPSCPPGYKEMKRYISIAVCLLTILLLTTLSFAEKKSFIREYIYEAGEIDSKISCRAIALEQVKRLLLEELGTYVQSVTVVKDYALNNDQITTLTAGVVQTTIREEAWDGKQYWLKAEIKADPDEVAAFIDKMRNDQQLVQDLTEAREEAAQALRDVESMKEQLALAQTDQAKRETYNSAVNQLIATDWFERGQALSVSGQYEDATRAYERVIVLKPNYTKAYSYRGLSYVQLGYYNRAVKDFDRAITLNPGNKKIYVQREIAVRKMKNPPQQTTPKKLAPVVRYDEKSRHNEIRKDGRQPRPFRLEAEIKRPVGDRTKAERGEKLMKSQRERQLQEKALREERLQKKSKQEERQQKRKKAPEEKRKRDKQILHQEKKTEN